MLATPRSFIVAGHLREAVPFPADEAVVPVVALPSGGTLLKSHCATIVEGTLSTVRVAAFVTLPAKLVTTTE